MPFVATWMDLEILILSEVLSPRATTTEAQGPRAHAPQQEKPPR